MNEHEWQIANEQQLRERLHRLKSRADGVLLIEPSGPHFVIVTKHGHRLRLALIEQARPQSDVTQSHLDLDDPLFLVSPYQQAAMLALVWLERPQRIASIGLGGGRFQTVLHHYLPDAIIDCAEIDPTVTTIARKFFGLPVDNRLRIHHADGRQWLEQQAGHAEYDLLFVDAFLDKGYSPYSLATREFCLLCQNHLAEDGLLVINLLQSDPFTLNRIRTVQDVFDQTAMCSVTGGNCVLFAGRSIQMPPAEFMVRVHAAQRQYAFHFPLLEHGDELVLHRPLIEAFPDLPGAQVLLDASPPAGYFDTLPEMNSPFSRIAPQSPCLCGSGRPFSECHSASRQPTHD